MKTSLLATIVFVGLAGVFTERAAGYPYHDFETKFRSEVIDDQIRIGYGIAIADVQGDGLPDIVLVDAREVVWYENKNPGWEKHVITGALTERDHVCVAAQDIDGDGKAEIAVGAGWNPGDTENSGAVFTWCRARTAPNRGSRSRCRTNPRFIECTGCVRLTTPITWPCCRCTGEATAMEKGRASR